MSYVRLDFTIWRGCDFGPCVLTMTEKLTGEPLSLVGWRAESQARKNPGDALALDFAPVVSQDADGPDKGKVTISQTKEQTLAAANGGAQWDLVLIDPQGYRLPPFVGGALTIKTPSTEAAPVS